MNLKVDAEIPSVEQTNLKIDLNKISEIIPNTKIAYSDNTITINGKIKNQQNTIKEIHRYLQESIGKKLDIDVQIQKNIISIIIKIK